MIEELDLEAIEARLEDGDYLPQPHWAEEDVEELIAEVKRLRQDRAEVRRDALLEAARAMCWICADGKHELVLGNDGNYWHKADWLTRCHSQAIHMMITADQGQGKE